MEYKKYAPLIGKKLTWDIIESLMKDMRSQINAESLKARKLNLRRVEKKKSSQQMEDDGS